MSNEKLKCQLHLIFIMKGMSEQEQFKRFKKDRILTEITSRDSSYPAELAKATGLPIDEVNSLLEELLSENLIEKIVSKYYQLTYAGDKYSKMRS